MLNTVLRRIRTGSKSRARVSARVKPLVPSTQYRICRDKPRGTKSAQSHLIVTLSFFGPFLSLRPSPSRCRSEDAERRVQSGIPGLGLRYVVAPFNTEL
jgi:hypothetical protein